MGAEAAGTPSQPAVSSSRRGRPSPAAGPPSFTVHVDVVTGHLTVTGRLDGRSSHRLHDAVSVLLRAGHPTLTVDATGLDVADHAGLRAIIGVYRRALRHGRRITVHGASPSLQHALTRLRLDGHVLQGAGEPSRGDPPPVGGRMVADRSPDRCTSPEPGTRRDPPGS